MTCIHASRIEPKAGVNIIIFFKKKDIFLRLIMDFISHIQSDKC